jgi:hypothetical protein
VVWIDVRQEALFCTSSAKVGQIWLLREIIGSLGGKQGARMPRSAEDCPGSGTTGRRVPYVILSDQSSLYGLWFRLCGCDLFNSVRHCVGFSRLQAATSSSGAILFKPSTVSLSSFGGSDQSCLRRISFGSSMYSASAAAFLICRSLSQ